MMPSLYSGISGLTTHQQRMNVIANNLANVNTVGYKSSYTTFKEAAIQTLRTPTASTPGRQIGYGVNIGGITRRFSNGALSETGQPTNMAINGNGFFVVQGPTGANYMTRAGDFVIDLNNPDGVAASGDEEINLITPDGYRLMNENMERIDLTPTSGEELASFSISSTGTISLTDTAGTIETLDAAGQRVKLTMFQNNNGLKAEGANLYSWTVAAGGTAPAAGDNVAAVGELFQGYLENSNVDVTQEFTDMIVTQRGFQANAKTITTSDEILQELMNIKR